ncbi:unnamed protein product [Closterium sp. NIES-65]|nr:unnamed protein product [Closterium sp. NIES-65]
MCNTCNSLPPASRSVPTPLPSLPSYPSACSVPVVGRVLQWSGEVHSVHKVSAAECAACTFVKAKQLVRNRNYGSSYWYKAWTGEVHSVHKVNAAEYAARTFLHPLPFPPSSCPLTPYCSHTLPAVFQWTGEVHSVHKVSAAEYAACTFVKAKQLARNRNYGSYWYKVNWREYGKTIYFSSKANKDCSLGIKVAFSVGS